MRSRSALLSQYRRNRGEPILSGLGLQISTGSSSLSTRVPVAHILVSYPRSHICFPPSIRHPRHAHIEITDVPRPAWDGGSEGVGARCTVYILRSTPILRVFFGAVELRGCSREWAAVNRSHLACSCAPLVARLWASPRCRDPSWVTLCEEEDTIKNSSDEWDWRDANVEERGKVPALVYIDHVSTFHGGHEYRADPRGRMTRCRGVW
jgi:hypothetical protein